MSTASPATEPQATAPPRPVQKRIYLPLILLGVLTLVAFGFVVRGTWADTEVRNPATPDDGTMTQLLRKHNGNVVVRCAVVVDAPPAHVWDVVKGYSRHHEFLPYVSKVEATKQGDGRFLIDGIAHSRIWGDWPFQSLATHHEAAEEGEYSALWSEHNVGPFAVNRGGWTLSPIGADRKQTLLVFTLQIELKDYPNFIVRNVIMDRVHSVLKAMRDEALQRKQA